MSFLFSQYEVSYIKTVHAPVERVVDFLRDTRAMMQLSPVITDVSNPNPEDLSFFRVEDTVTFLGLKSKTVYNARVGAVEGGMHAVSTAAAGTETTSTYTAHFISTNETEVREKVSVKAFFLLLPFIKGVIHSAHNTTLELLAAKLASELEGKESPSP